MAAALQEKRAVSARRIVEISLLVAVWWAGNALYAVDAQRLLRSASDGWVAGELALVQLSLGALLAHIYVHATVHVGELPAPSAKAASSTPLVSLALIAAGITNFAGAVLTNVSYRALGSTSTLVWKLAEPFAVVALKRLVLGVGTSPAALVGVAHVVAGVLLFARAGRAAPSLSVPVAAANVAYPLRNVLVKLDQRAGARASAAHAYRTLMLLSLPYAMLLAVAATIIRGAPLPMKMAPALLRNALLFNAYQIASMALLRRLDALTHAVGNTLKRFSAILLSVVIGREFLDAQRVTGLLVAAVGFFLYTASSGALADRPIAAFRVRSGAIAASFAIVLYNVFTADLSAFL